MLQTEQQYAVGTIGVLSQDLIACLEQADRREQEEIRKGGKDPAKEWKPKPRREALKQFTRDRAPMRIEEDGFTATGNGAGEPYLRVAPVGGSQRGPYSVKAKHYIPTRPMSARR